MDELGKGLGVFYFRLGRSKHLEKFITGHGLHSGEGSRGNSQCKSARIGTCLAHTRDKKV